MQNVEGSRKFGVTQGQAIRPLVSNPLAGAESEAISSDPRWKLAQRVAASAGFQQAARLREFLLHVCACAIRQRPDEATEQQIGIQVFGRPASYNPNEDNVVRSQARLLRLKLGHYFAGEGIHEPVVITIPKGHYLPVFEARTSAQETPNGERQAVARPPRRLSVTTVVLALLVLVLSVACAFFYTRWSAAKAGEAPVERAFDTFWNQVFKPKERTEIVISDHTYGALQEAAGHAIPLSVYTSSDFARVAHEIQVKSGLGKLLFKFDVSHLTGLYDVTNVAQLASLKQYRNAIISIRFARDANIHDLLKENVVLIGSRHTDPWVERFGANLNFDFSYDYNQKYNYAVNRKPKPGEQLEYRPTDSGVESVDYAGVALVPGLYHRGNVLILSATSLAGGDMACEFITNERLCSHFLEAIAAESGGRSPYFEVLLRTVSYSGRQTTTPEVVAYRTIPRPQ